MTRQEALAIAGYIGVSFPTNTTDSAIAALATDLERYDAGEAQAAARVLRDNRTDLRLPSWAEIRQTIDSIHERRQHTTRQLGEAREPQRKSDAELIRMWRDGGIDREGHAFQGGWVRHQDGRMYRTDTGEVCAATLRVPERSLPPLPDWTRPNQEYQVIGVHSNVKRKPSPPPWIVLRERARLMRMQRVESEGSP